jgi:Glycosyl transferase family 2
MRTVRRLTERKIPTEGVLCMALAHNEAKRTKDFLRHYRRLGVVHFLIVDDHSTDGTKELLQDQPDVTIFVPCGTNYRDHKKLWRQEILDDHAHGRWVLVPDLDELFVYPHCDIRSLGSFTAHIEQEGAQAAFSPMIDMYADAPLDRVTYEPGTSMVEACPFFDATGYRLVAPKSKFLKRFPIPALDMYGGPRERIFYDFSEEMLTSPRRWILRRFAHLHRSMQPNFFERACNLLVRLSVKRKAPQPPLLMSKIALLKWREGLSFSGGPHAVSAPLPLSANWGALLHFKFIDLPALVAYNAERKQHAAGGGYYKKMRDRGGYQRSPIYEGSRRYTGWRDLLECGLLRCSTTWDVENHPVSPSQPDSLIQAG